MLYAFNLHNGVYQLFSIKLEKRKQHVLHSFNVWILGFLLACLFKFLTLCILNFVKPFVIILPFLAPIIMTPIQTPTTSN